MLQKGTPITITFGPFAGFPAKVVSSQLKRVVVRVALKRDVSVLVELEDDMIMSNQESHGSAGNG